MNNIKQVYAMLHTLIEQVTDCKIECPGQVAQPWARGYVYTHWHTGEIEFRGTTALVPFLTEMEVPATWRMTHTLPHDYDTKQTQKAALSVARKHGFKYAKIADHGTDKYGRANWSLYLTDFDYSPAARF